MNKHLKLLIILIFAPALVPVGCGNTSTGNGGGDSANITVTVRDDTGKPLPGFTVSSPAVQIPATTDSSGNALLEHVPAGFTGITVSKAGYPPFSQSITIKSGEPQALVFIYIPQVTLTVRDEKNREVSGATISTLPETYNVITDTNGTAVFENMPLASLKFSVRRASLPDFSITLETKRELAIVAASGSPSVDILLPRMDDAYSSPRNIQFSGKGSDFEDGELPDSSLVWISDKDGVLGSGKNLTVSLLSQGYHTVTLRGTDSDGRQGETTISFFVFDYQPDSYFPIPAGETWKYRYLVPEFYITNSDNVSEYWVLKNLTAKITTDSRRVVDIYWDIIVQKATTHFHLTLSDSLLMENGTVYVSQTTEQSKEWLASEDKSYFIMNIGTFYTPRYVFLKNVADITAETSYQSTSLAETEFSYIYNSVRSPVYYDSKAITTSVRIGDEETIQTDRGLMQGILVTIRQGDSEKKWYLKRGIGLIRFEDMALSISTVGVLSEASLLRFNKPSLKTAWRSTDFTLHNQGLLSGVSSSPGFPPLFDLRINRDKPGDMMRLHRFLAGMIPR